MKLKKRNRTLVVLMFLTLGMLSYSALPFLPTQVLPTKVSAYGLSPVPEKEGMVYAVTASGKLISFNFFTPSAINSNLNITGLQPGELLVGVDFRPRTGQLFGVTNQSRVYTINTLTGAVTQVGTVPFTPGVTGGAYGVDFNPVVDLIRVVTNLDDQNLRVNPNTGAVAGVDTTLAFAAGDANAGANPNLVGSAYTNSYSGATTTTLYGIDSDLNILVTQGTAAGVSPPVSPNTGQLFTVGQLGVDTTEMVGFDIAAPGNSALASLTTPGATTSSLYWIDLPTGMATLISQIGGGEPIRDIAIVTRVETIFALTQSNNLISFNSGTPGTPIRSLPITGISAGETLVGLDFRPATGELYSFGTSGSLYTVNTSTGLATLVGTSVVAAAANIPQIGFDFNPAPDLIRLVTGNDQDLRINPNNVVVAGVDGTLAFATGDANVGVDPNVVASAYLNNVAGPTPPAAGDPSTALYGIDSNLDILVTQGTAFGVRPVVSPNTGQLFTIGGLVMGGMPVDVTGDVGFDIAPETGAAFASLTLQAAPTSSTLVTVNLASGAVTPIGTIAGGEVITDIALGVRIDKVYALTGANTLVSFNSRTPNILMSTVSIRGLQGGESIVGIDYRPATGQLYGFGSNSGLYTIDPISGIAALVGTPLTPPLGGTSYGFDFNPVPDRIRIISNQPNSNNIRLNPVDGTLLPDTDLSFAVGDIFAGQTPSAVAAAYTNSFAGTTSTTLFVIDSMRSVLARQGSQGGTPDSPNNGRLSTIGPLGMAITTGQVGFDISDCSNTGYASFRPQGATQSQLYRINLRTGVATPVNVNSTINVSGEVMDIAVQTNFTSSAVDAGFMVTNSASFNIGTVAPDSITTLFGSFQATDGQPSTSTTLPAPTTLGSITVTVNGVAAGLYYVSNSQINLRVPSGVSDGPAIVQVTNTANGATRTGRANIVRAAPGIFTANGTGMGTVFALTTFDGITYQPVIDAMGNEVPILPTDANGRPNIIAVFATGLRNAMAANPNDGNGVAEAVMATIQGNPVPVAYAGLAGLSTELDQFNITIPSNLAGIGQVSLQINVNGQTSNVVTFTIGGTAPPPVPQRVSLGQTVNGSLTSTDPLQLLQAGADKGTYFYDFYRFTASANTSIAIDLRSANFNAATTLFQVVVDGNGTETLNPIAFDDDSGGGLGIEGITDNRDSLLSTVLPASGDYLVSATSSNVAPSATGAYTLRIFDNPFQAISYGANIRGSIGTGDSQSSGGAIYDVYRFTGSAGDPVQIRMSSDMIDSFLELKLTDGTRFAVDNNSLGGPNGKDAIISTTLPYTGSYLVYATHADRKFLSGSYTLSLTRSGRGMANNANPAGTEKLASKSTTSVTARSATWSVRLPF
jgi:trimeric autotransporter adhesin